VLPWQERRKTERGLSGGGLNHRRTQPPAEGPEVATALSTRRRPGDVNRVSRRI
jgi:hypothetical protein